MPTTVLHLIASNFLGGPERQILGHADAVSPARIRCLVGGFVDAGRPNELLAQASARGHRTFALEARRPWSAGQVTDLQRYLQDQRVQILCAHGYRAIAVGLIAGRRAGIPVLAFPRGWTAENLKVRLFQLIMGYLLRYADAVVAVSEAQARYIESRFGVRPARVFAVHNAVDAEAFPNERHGSDDLRAEFGIPPGAPVVVSAGRLSPEKGHRHLVAAASEALAVCPDARFLLVGEGPERARLESEVSRLGLGRRVLLVGFRKDVARFLLAADLVVLPSLTEGLPNVLLEAAAAGRARVATAVGGVPEVIEHGVSGLLVAPADPAALANAIAACLRDSGLRRKLGEAARIAARERFRFDHQAGCLEAIYAQLLHPLSCWQSVGPFEVDGSSSSLSLPDVSSSSARGGDGASGH